MRSSASDLAVLVALAVAFALASVGAWRVHAKRRRWDSALLLVSLAGLAAWGLLVGVVIDAALAHSHTGWLQTAAGLTMALLPSLLGGVAAVSWLWLVRDLGRPVSLFAASVILACGVTASATMVVLQAAGQGFGRTSGPDRHFAFAAVAFLVAIATSCFWLGSRPGRRVHSPIAALSIGLALPIAMNLANRWFLPGALGPLLFLALLAFGFGYRGHPRPG
jgi:hypothetical protein